MKAYFNYNPVGNSMFAYIDKEGEQHTTVLTTETNNALVEFLVSSVVGYKINQLYCNNQGLEVATAARHILNQNYGYNALEILENK